MATNFRNVYKFLLPAWLTTDDADKVAYSLAILADDYWQWARNALEARMPSRAGASALALIGADRGIPQGRSETSAHYAARLIGWRYPRGHRTRGSAYALLEQVAQYFGGINCWTIDQNGNRYLRAPDGTQSSSAAWPWNWDGSATPKYRFWLVLEPAYNVPTIKPWPAVLGAWGGTCLNPAVTIGQQGITPDDCAAIAGLFKGRAWKPAGTMQQFAIITFGDYHTETQPAPDGTWQTDKGRNNAFRFWII